MGVRSCSVWAWSGSRGSSGDGDARRCLDGPRATALPALPGDRIFRPPVKRSMTTMLDSRAARYSVLIILASGMAPAPARADIAHLKNGQTVEISGFTIEGERIILALEGGGELAIPTRNVASIQRVATEQTAWRPEARRGGPADQGLVAP